MVNVYPKNSKIFTFIGEKERKAIQSFAQKLPERTVLEEAFKNDLLRAADNVDYDLYITNIKSTESKEENAETLKVNFPVFTAADWENPEAVFPRSATTQEILLFIVKQLALMDYEVSNQLYELEK